MNVFVMKLFYFEKKVFRTKCKRNDIQSIRLEIRFSKDFNDKKEITFLQLFLFNL